MPRAVGIEPRDDQLRRERARGWRAEGHRQRRRLSARPPRSSLFTKDGEVLVGETAKRQAVTNVDRTVSSVKRHMGTTWTFDVDGKKWTPQEISARILQKLKRVPRSTWATAWRMPSSRCPVLQRRRAPGYEGGRRDRGPERPAHHQRAHTAAALAYGLDKGKEDELILVFDLGGGTFDVSPARGWQGRRLLDHPGARHPPANNRLGGDDRDQRVVDYLIKQFKDTTGVDVSGDKIALQRLKEAAEQAKKELSSSTSTSINLPTSR